MSRVIENDHPFTDEEIEYLEGRRRIREIALNKKEFPRNDEKPSQKLSLDPEIFEYVKGLNDEELLASLQENGLETQGDVKTLKKNLALHLQAKKDAE